MTAFKLDLGPIEKGLNGLDDKLMMALEMFSETGAKKMEAYAKENKPWTTRSGRAVQSLHGYHERTPRGYRIVLAHGVDYGVWLELAHEKKYAILQPTIEHKGPEVIRGLERFLERMK